MKRYFILITVIPFFISCLKDEPVKREFEGYTPVDQHDDWQLSSPEKENMDEAKLNQAYELILSERSIHHGSQPVGFP